MKKITTLSLWALLAMPVLPLSAQTLVSTDPQPKNAIIEEFTGVRCPNCPAGHVIVKDMLADNPGRVHVVAYHPTGSNYTSPYTGDPDFRRTFPATFYSTAYAGGRFMPGAMINRQTFNDGNKIQSRGVWKTYANQVMQENSPMNVGAAATYNSATNTISIDVEVYYTDDVNDEHNINVQILENGLIARQSSGSVDYEHKHMFRESLTAQWGDAMDGSSTKGSLYTKTFTFNLDNAQQPIDINKADVMVFVSDKASTEVYTGTSVSATGATTSINDQVKENIQVSISPNPAYQFANVSFLLPQPTEADVTVTNILGETLSTHHYDALSSGRHSHRLDFARLGLSKGIYLVQVATPTGSIAKKLIVR